MVRRGSARAVDQTEQTNRKGGVVRLSGKRKGRLFTENDEIKHANRAARGNPDNSAGDEACLDGGDKKAVSASPGRRGGRRSSGHFTTAVEPSSEAGKCLHMKRLGDATVEKARGETKEKQEKGRNEAASEHQGTVSRQGGNDPGEILGEEHLPEDADIIFDYETKVALEDLQSELGRGDCEQFMRQQQAAGDLFKGLRGLTSSKLVDNSVADVEADPQQLELRSGVGKTVKGWKGRRRRSNVVSSGPVTEQGETARPQDLQAVVTGLTSEGVNDDNNFALRRCAQTVEDGLNGMEFSGEGKAMEAQASLEVLVKGKRSGKRKKALEGEANEPDSEKTQKIKSEVGNKAEGGNCEKVVKVSKAAATRAALEAQASASQSKEPWTFLVHRKAEAQWVAYNPATMRRTPVPKEGQTLHKLISWNVNGIRRLMVAEGLAQGKFKEVSEKERKRRGKVIGEEKGEADSQGTKMKGGRKRTEVESVQVDLTSDTVLKIASEDLSERPEEVGGSLAGVEAEDTQEDTQDETLIVEAQGEGGGALQDVATEMKSLASIVERENPDVICMQETKLQDKYTELLKDKLLPDYPYTFWSCSTEKLGYSGCALFSKVAPLNVTYGLGAPEHDGEGRVITAEFEKFYLAVAYVPNSSDGLKRLPYREHQWDPALAEHLKELEKKKPAVLTGDLNVCHEEIDIHHPDGNRRSAGFTDEERQSFQKQYLDRGFVDTFRRQHPDRVGYSYWCHRMGSRVKNAGWRLDYFVASPSLTKDDQFDSFTLPDVLGSDHCPIGFTFCV
eukprot:TRINITY_DN4307_c0_g1_i1.p1 TRINITY_DN4307_c0_g1~~TRINITY_DN4307_c0_g1_i1.p1  ORF type:complete len:788 (-),score=141.32 TRINITY_DN4307_c0_g1_i1:925-3288(-)